jgi:DNA mismatch repair protein MSH6
LKKEMAQA